MAVKNLDERYRCAICGNEVVVTTVGGGTLVCCGQKMELVEEEPVRRTTNLPDSGGN